MKMLIELLKAVALGIGFGVGSMLCQELWQHFVRAKDQQARGWLGALISLEAFYLLAAAGLVLWLIDITARAFQ